MRVTARGNWFRLTLDVMFLVAMGLAAAYIVVNAPWPLFRSALGDGPFLASLLLLGMLFLASRAARSRHRVALDKTLLVASALIGLYALLRLVVAASALVLDTHG